MVAMEVDTSNLQRKQSLYQSQDERFEIKMEKYTGQQYIQIYFARIHKMRAILYSLVEKWKPQLPVCTVLGLELGKECLIVGTLYKHMKLKLYILNEYSKERSVVPVVKPHNFMHPDDQLVLEDEWKNKTWWDFYRVVVALHGKETTSGEFFVIDILDRGLPPQIELPLDSREDKFVVLVSGLSIGNGKSNPLNVQLLVDHITGHLGDAKEQSMASQIVRVVIAGIQLSIHLHLFLGTSGQNIDDLEKYSEAKDKLDFMERTLISFLIEDCPHVYFVGNQSKYDTQLSNGSEGQSVRLICIPKFCETGIAVVLNLKNLESHTLSLSANLDS
ncbi:hypothetical protein MKX01_011237 [Papaver californicum]|nr:hypothetical protein MKX01_011237 [Papaver californicum]